jgi:cell division protein FtsA
MSRGYVTNVHETAGSVETAVARAEKIAGVKVRRAYVSFGGIGLESVTATATTIISRADLEITERDISLVLEGAEAAIPPSAIINRKIINTVPLEYKIDGKATWGQALGLKAQKLEVKALFITCLEHHLNNLIKTVELAGIEVADVVAAPVAASFVTLSKKQKKVGTMLVDIGAETLSTVIFENGNLISLKVFPVGSADLINSIALEFKLSLEDAESVLLGRPMAALHSRRKIDDVISLQLKELFEYAFSHLKSIGRDGLLPGGSVLIGGAAAISGVKKASEEILKLPSQLAEIYFGPKGEEKIKDCTWAIACGLSLVGFNSDDEQQTIGIRNVSLFAVGGKRWGKMIMRWISQFLP